MPPANKLAINTPAFWDEQSLLAEERRQFDVCHGCRLCWNFCPAFPELFDRTDAVDGEMRKLTRETLRPVEDLCYQCKLCHIRCPYTSPHDYDLDIPRLFLRAKLVNAKNDGVKLQDRLLGDTDLVGMAGSLTAPLANLGNSTKPVRIVLEKTLGIHRNATLPKFHAQTFSAWFKRHGKAANARVSKATRKVALFTTCTVNFNDPPTGIACVDVLTHNNVEVLLPKQQCCGMPFLDGGALEQAMAKIKANTASLADVVRQGYDIVVPGPTCSYTIKKEYPLLEETEDARLVSAHTFDISEYLWKLKIAGALRTDFRHRLGKVAYHAPCHLRAQHVGAKAAGLMELVPGTEVEQIERCSAHDGSWGVKAASHEVSLRYGEKLFNAMADADATLWASDCPLSAIHILHATGRKPVHPMQLLKTAYGI